MQTVRRSFAQEPHGGWRFAGREDSLVKIHGRWVNLVELEERLASRTPGVREAHSVAGSDVDLVAIVAVPDHEAIATTVTERISKLDGVLNTTTMIVGPFLMAYFIRDLGGSVSDVGLMATLEQVAALSPGGRAVRSPLDPAQ